MTLIEKLRQQSSEGLSHQERQRRLALMGKGEAAPRGLSKRKDLNRTSRVVDIFICESCGCEFPVNKVDQKRGQRFCEKTCRTLEYYYSKFMSQVSKENGCWVWKGPKHPKGYGLFQTTFGNRCAHQFSFMLFNGEIPEGMFVCHHCDNPSCVDPDHLFIGTPNDNMQDMIRKGRAIKPSVLTHQEVIEIREFLKTHSYKETQDKFSISETTVYRIKHRKSWKIPHLNVPTRRRLNARISTTVSANT